MRFRVTTAENKYQGMTQGPLGKAITKMAVPAVIGNIVAIIYNLTDTFYVGLLGTADSAASGVVMPLMVMVQSCGLLLGMGAANLLSVELGRKNIKRGQELVMTAFYSTLVFGLLIMVIGLCFRTPLAWILGSTRTIEPLAVQYMFPLLCSAPFYAASFVLNPTLRFQGLANDSAIGIVIGAILNIGLEPIFIFTFHLGMLGAGIATAICQTISFLILLILYIKKAIVPFKSSCFTFRGELWREMLATGFPSFSRNMMLAVSSDMLNVAANPYGDVAIAAMTIVTRILTLSNTAQIGVSQGYQTVCGFNYGAQLHYRVRRGYWMVVRTTAIFLTIISILQIIFAPHLVRLFQSDPSVVRLGSEALRIDSITFTAQAFIVVSNQMEQTLGHQVISTITGFGRQGLFLIPALFIFPHFFGFMGVMISQPVSDICTFVMTVPLQTYVLRRLRTEEKNHQNNLTSTVESEE